MHDIRQQIFTTTYEQCKKLLVPEFTTPLGDIVDDLNVDIDTPIRLMINPNLVIPRRFITDDAIDALSADDIVLKYPDIVLKYPGDPTEKRQVRQKAIRQVRNIAFKNYETEIQVKFPQFGERIIRYLRPDPIETENLERINALPGLMISIGSNYPVGDDPAQKTETPLGNREKQVALKIRLALTEEENYNSEGSELDLARSRTGYVFRIWQQLFRVLNIDFFPTKVGTAQILRTDISTGEVEKSEVYQTIFEYAFSVSFTERITR